MIDIRLEKFEGPLDLLLKLLDKNKIDIYDIPINTITNQYLQVIEVADFKADEVSEFLVMASTLLEIKSKMLLPKQDSLESDPREELVNRLLEYKRAKLYQEFLKDKKLKADNFFQRIHGELVVNINEINLEEDVKLLKDIFTNILRSKLLDEIDLSDKIKLEKDDTDIKDYISTIYQVLVGKKKVRLTTLIKDKKKKIEIIVTFIAVLELIKSKTIVAVQAGRDDLILQLVEKYE